jgi:hypothetical protein
MPTTSIAARMVFVDPENPSFDPGQVLVIYESIDPESPCYYYAVYENVTWFNPRLKFTPFADRRKCYNNQFRLIEANAVALAMQPKKCIHVWAALSSVPLNWECLSQEYIPPIPSTYTTIANHDPHDGNRKIFNIPDGMPIAFQLSIQDLSIEAGEHPGAGGPGWEHVIVDEFWQSLSPRPDGFYKNKTWTLNLVPTESVYYSSPRYMTYNGDDNLLYSREDTRITGQDASKWLGEGETVDVAYVSEALFEPCQFSRHEGDPPLWWSTGSVPPMYVGRIHIAIGVFFVTEDTPEGHEYYYGFGNFNHRIDLAVYKTGDGTIEITAPVNCHLLNQYGGGSPIAISGANVHPLNFKLNATGVRLEPVY